MARGHVRRFGTAHVQGGGVPGGHAVFTDLDEPNKPPFVTPMAECLSIALRHTDVVADIGAYVGTYTLIAARHPVTLVRAYEPTPRTLDVLRTNAARLPNIELVPGAVVGDTHGGSTVELFLSQGIGVTNSTTQRARKVGGTHVPAVRYRDAVAGATVVKIDIEGGEYSLPIAQDARERPELRALIIDFHPVAGFDWNTAAQQLVCDVEAAGFRPVLAPTFGASGWERAGSWVRDTPQTADAAAQAGSGSGSGCTALLSGAQCSGCGIALTPCGHKALCIPCRRQWSDKHLRAFGYAPRKAKTKRTAR